MIQFSTTPWQNGCAFATVSHLLSQIMGSPNWQHYSQLSGTSQLLGCFSELYKSPNLSWDRIKAVLNGYVHPHDQQIIWIAPLRKLLSQTLKNNDSYRDNAFHTFSSILNNYLDNKSCTTDEYINIFLSNKDFFDECLNKLQNAAENKKAEIKNSLLDPLYLQNIWNTKGFTQYCDFVGNYQDNSPMITAEELSHLCHILRLELSIETNRVAKGYQNEDKWGTLNAVCAGHHWQPLERISSSNSYRLHKLLCSKGTSELISLKADEICQKMSTELSPSNTPIVDVYLENNRRKSTTKLAEYIQENPNLFCHQGAGRSILENAVTQKDIYLLILLYQFSIPARNSIISTLFCNQENGLLLSIINYTAKMQKVSHPNSSMWSFYFDKFQIKLKEPLGDTALHAHIRRNNIIAAKALIEGGADIYAGNYYGLTPLHLACAFGAEEVILCMIQKRKAEYVKLSWFARRLEDDQLKLTLQDSDGKTPLHYAAAYTPKNILKLFIDPSKNPYGSSFKVDTQDNEKNTLLHYAASNSNEAVLTCLIEHLASFYSFKNKNNRYLFLSLQNHVGFTALHSAILAKQQNNAIALLKFGCSTFISAFKPEIQKLIPSAKSGLTAACLALDLGLVDIIPHCFTLPISFRSIQSSKGLYATHVAAKLGRHDLIEKWKYILRFPVDLHLDGDPKGRTAIHWAAIGNQLETIKYLLKNGASLLNTDSNGNTPLHYAAKFGHASIVQFICEQIQLQNEKYQALSNTDNAYYGFKKRIGTLRQFSWRITGLLDVDQKNKHGETAFLLADINNRTPVLNILAQHHAKKSGVMYLFTKAIFPPRHKQSANDAQNEKLIIKQKIAKKQKNEERAAKMAAKHKDKIYSYKNNDGNNLIHLCVMNLQFRMINILLHPFSIKEKIGLCTALNASNQTPLMMIKEFKLQLQASNASSVDSKQLLIVLEKIERLLIQYNPNQFNLEYDTLRKKIQYHWRWTQDIKEELMTSSWYQTGAKCAMFMIPAYTFTTTTIATGNPLAGLIVAGEQLLQGDLLYTIERGIGFANPYLKESLQQKATFLQRGLNAAGWITNTPRRAATWAIGQAYSLGLNVYHPHFDNYLTEIKYMGVGLVFSEELIGRHLIGKLAETQLPSLENVLNLVWIPSPQQAVRATYTALNTKIAQVTGFNLLNTLLRSYEAFKEQAGGILTPASSYDKNVLPALLEHYQSNDEAARNLLASVGRELYIQYFYEPETLEQKISQLFAYANTGAITDNALISIDEGCQLQQDMDYGMCIATLATNNIFYQESKFSDDTGNAFFSQISAEVEAIKSQNPAERIASLKDIISEVNSKAINDSAKRITADYFTPVGETGKSDVSPIVLKSIIDFMEKHFGDPLYIFAGLEAISKYSNSNQLTTIATEIFYEMAMLAHEQGENFEQTYALLIMNTSLYTSGLISADELHSLGSQLTQDVKAIFEQDESIDISTLEASTHKTISEAILLYSSAFAAKYVSPALITSNPAHKNLIENGLTTFLVNHLSEDPNISFKIEDFIYFANGAYPSDNAIQVLHEIASDTEKAGGSYADTIADLVMGSYYIQSFHFDNNNIGHADFYKVIRGNILAQINQIDREQEGCDMTSELNEVLETTFADTRSYYLKSAVSGTRAVDDFANATGCRSTGCAEYRALHLADKLYYRNQSYFGKLTQSQYDQVIEFIKTIILNAQKNKNKREKCAADNYNNFTIFFLCAAYVNEFFSNKPLSAQDRAVFMLYEQPMIRAAFAAHGLNLLLQSSPDYKAMDFGETYSLYMWLIDDQYNKSSRAEDSFYETIYTTILGHRVSKNDTPTLAGGFTPVEAADYIKDGSKDAAEFRWHGTPESQTRAIGIERRSEWSHFWHGAEGKAKEVACAVLSQYGLGFIITPTQQTVGLYNLKTEGITNLSHTFSKPSTFNSKPNATGKNPQHPSNSHSSQSTVGIGDKPARPIDIQPVGFVSHSIYEWEQSWALLASEESQFMPHYEQIDLMPRDLIGTAKPSSDAPKDQFASASPKSPEAAQTTAERIDQSTQIYFPSPTNTQVDPLAGLTAPLNTEHENDVPSLGMSKQPEHSQEPVFDPSFYSPILGSRPSPLIFSQPAGLIASRVAPLSLLAQETDAAPEPLAPKKPSRASIEEIGPEPESAKPVSVPNTEAPSTRPLVEALLTSPKTIRDNPLTTIVAAYSGSTTCESDKDCVRPAPASIKPSPVKAQSPEMDFMDKQWQQSIDDLSPKQDAAYFNEEFAKIYQPASIGTNKEEAEATTRPSPAQMPAAELLSEATASGDLKAVGVVGILTRPAKTITYDPLEAALELYAPKPDVKVSDTSQQKQKSLAAIGASGAIRGSLSGLEDLVDLALHPIDSTKDIGELLWDLGNLASDKMFDISTQESKERNQARAAYIYNALMQFKEGSAEYQTEKSSELLGSLFGPQAFLKAATGLKILITAGKAGTAGKGIGLVAFAGFQKAVKQEQTRLIMSSKRISSDIINKEFITENALKEGWLPPYPPNLSLRIIQLSRETKFYRVHYVSEMITGRFLARAEEIAPFLSNPEALRLHLGLPNVPIYITEVNVPAKKDLVAGRIGPQPKFGLMKNSGFQYQLLKKLPESCFVNTRLILDPKSTPSKKSKLSTSVEY